MPLSSVVRAALTLFIKSQSLVSLRTIGQYSTRIGYTGHNFRKEFANWLNISDPGFEQLFWLFLYYFIIETFLFLIYFLMQDFWVVFSECMQTYSFCKFCQFFYGNRNTKSYPVVLNSKGGCIVILSVIAAVVIKNDWSVLYPIRLYQT